MPADVKLSRRLAGYTHKRLSELNFSQVQDKRKNNVKWKLSVLLKAVVLGIMTGCKGLGEVETHSQNASKFMQKALGFSKRVPDSTVRDALVKLDPNQLRPALHDMIKDAHRRKALEVAGLPFGVIACDGKKTSTRMAHDKYAQLVSDYEGETPKYTVGSVTCCLTSSAAKACVDAMPLPAATNEKGILPLVVDELLATYGHNFFKMITYDAGGCSKQNASFIDDKGLYYVFTLKADQPTLYKRAVKLLGNLGHEEVLHETVDKASGGLTVRRIWVTKDMNGFHRWMHLKTVLRVESQTTNLKTGEVTESYSRYFISNAGIDILTPEQWLQVIRAHWAVENNCHNTFDKILREDERPFIFEPQGMLIIMLLRRIAYNLLALFRSVTQRSEKNRATPWKDLIGALYLMLITLEYSGLSPNSKLARLFGTS